MDRPEDELPPRFIEAAQVVVMMPPFATEEQTSKAIEAVRLAILKAREEAFEECEKLIVKDIDYHNRRDDPEHQAVGAWVDPFKVASAIRQHSQKGER